MNLLQNVLAVRKERLEQSMIKHGDHVTLAACFHAIGKPEEGLPLLKEVFATRLETLGPEHPKTLQMMNDLAETITCLAT